METKHTDQLQVIKTTTCSFHKPILNPQPELIRTIKLTIIKRQKYCLKQGGMSNLRGKAF